MKMDMERVKELAELVQYHSDLYYNQSKPEITDKEFDDLRDELKSLVEQADEQGLDTPEVNQAKEVLQGVGAVPTYGKKVTHERPMGSLDKENTVEDIIKWHSKYAKSKKVVITPKIDGASVRLTYLDGKLIQAATRGTGEVGQDITDNIMVMKSVPKTIQAHGKVEVRVEAYMKKSVFASLVAKGEKAFANPRNAVSGSINAKDPAVTARRSLDVIAHDVYPEGVVFKTEFDKFDWMVRNLGGMQVVNYSAWDISDFEDVAGRWKSDRPSLDYGIDGLVIALNDVGEQEEAGWDGKRPRFKMAYKFPPAQAKAKVLAIDYQVGRTGRLTPMARIEPTLVDGSTVSNITLHNWRRVVELRLDVGDLVLISKAGDIIPQIEKNLNYLG